MCFVLVDIQTQHSYKLFADVNETPLGERKVFVTIPSDPRLPVQVKGHMCDVKVFALAVDIRPRKREALIEDDIPRVEGPKRGVYYVNNDVNTQ